MNNHSGQQTELSQSSWHCWPSGLVLLLLRIHIFMKYNSLLKILFKGSQFKASLKISFSILLWSWRNSAITSDIIVCADVIDWTFHLLPFYANIWKSFSSRIFMQFRYFYSQIDFKCCNPQKSSSLLPARKIRSILWQWSDPLPVGDHCTRHRNLSLFGERDYFHKTSPQTSTTSSYAQTTVSAPAALLRSQLHIHLCSPLLRGQSGSRWEKDGKPKKETRKTC